MDLFKIEVSCKTLVITWKNKAIYAKNGNINERYKKIQRLKELRRVVSFSRNINFVRIIW